MSDLDALRTPCPLLDVDVLDANLRRAADLAARLGVVLRPHAKTHKCVQVARRQLAAGAVGLTVATTAEAEAFAAGGATDLFVAYPLWVDADRGRRLRALAERTALRVGVDSAEGAAALARHAGGAAEVLVEVDSGHHRTGVRPEEAGAVATAAARAGLRVRGVFTFPGHAYGPGLASPVAGQEAAALAAAAAAVRAAGHEVDVVSGGSTPTLGSTQGGPATELRPGVYALNDAQQLELGTCGAGDLALTVLAMVVSRRPGTVVLDAGSKVLGADRPAWTTGWGRLPAVPGARVTALSEHHATVALPEGAAVPALGARLRVAPNHVCTAVNLADELVAVRGDAVVDRWRVDARGANT
ncbi:alanine racemase [Vallicoccus soli]|uniref:D-TA family PLP-dependent enzyme n=1 Tax=Vallicoccus soli TaxID=2339232 RepID=A0A3A3YWR1_9ACTN|nr:alanine racemase [Vallicoccus soli]RJK96048.1 D-TA family PLP-dependent enzyme [Vallicoccus soli]